MNSFNFSGERFSSLTTSYNQGISVSYALDLFGKLKHAKRAAWQDYLASDARRQAIVNSLIARVILSRIEIASLMFSLSW